MAVTVTEKYDSRALAGGDSATATLTYLIRGTADESAAYAALLAGAPATFNGMVQRSAATEPVHVDSTDANASIWQGTVSYGRDGSQRPDVGDSSYSIGGGSFDTTGGTFHVTQSISTSGRYAPAGQTAPDFKGAIGVSKDGVEGVDLTVPVYHFSETWILAAATVTDAYKGKLFALTGTVNNAAFRGLAAGECLFLGARGAMRAGGDWEVTFEFAASPNRASFAVGDITVTSKKGWEYMWVRYKDAVDQNEWVKVPASVHVEKVYQDGDFSQLGITP